MNTIKNLLRVIVVKASLVAVLAAFVLAAGAPAFAQSADVRYAGVFYKENPQTEKEMYCDYIVSGRTQGLSGTFIKVGSIVSKRCPVAGEIYDDGTLVVEYLGTAAPSTGGLGSAPVLRSSNTSYTVGAVYFFGHRVGSNQIPAYFRVLTAGTSGNLSNEDFWESLCVLVSTPTFADGELQMVYVGEGSSSCSSRQNETSYSLNDEYCLQVDGTFFLYRVDAILINGFPSISISTDSLQNRSFVFGTDPASASHTNDPWVSSALIEYDQPYASSASPSATPDYTANKYPNHCLALCMNVTCTNRPIGGSTYSIAFPLQQIKFDVVKYYNNKNVENPEEAPAVRTIDLYPNQDSAKCGSYRCPGGATDGATCNSAQYYCDGIDVIDKRDTNNGMSYVSKGHCRGDCKSFADDSVVASSNCSCSNGVCTFAVFNHDGHPSGGTSAIPFCASWDGSYEIAGEFGKTNGQFAYRATVKTDVPGDNIITDKISFDSTIAYPGMNQIPIQVDVTNIHTVRSTPTLVGNITSVSAQPYTYAYRLSKDSDVRIAIFDASNPDAEKYTSEYNTNIIGAADTNNATKYIVRTLVDWQPRIGEGMKGQEKDVQISEFDSWDGRNNMGMLLPAGNYIVSLQAKSADEWPGIDFSRAVTRQLSLDPLKLTDVVATGLTKQSTAYASIAYTPTESSKVYWYIYTPGTVFEQAGAPAGILTDSSTPTGTPPTVEPGTGSLVAVLEEDRVGRMNFTSKWDGLCGMSGGCIRTYAKNETMSNGTKCQNDTCAESFAYGAPMPDGNYVYALWAEIPYNGKYVNAVGGNGKPKFTAGAVCSRSNPEINTQCFTGVKTLKYTTGQIAIERGVVDVTIQPVSYATVGSSPTAYGLDPFIFKYSIARDSTVVAKITNTAGVDVKYLTPEDGITQVAQQMNTLSWDGRDDAGRMVTPATYMFVVETKDAMFPAVTNRASAVFPVDMYRVVDLATTDVYGDSDAKATISYALSKAMNVQVNIYNKDVVIPNYQTETGEYGSSTVTASYTDTTYTDTLGSMVNVTLNGATVSVVANDGTATTYTVPNRDTVTVGINPSYDGTSPTCTVADPSTCQYRVVVLREVLDLTTGSAAWPPRICDKYTDGTALGADSVFDSTGAVMPAKKPTCIYVNDTSFTNYPTTAAAAASGVVDVRLQPIKTFERSATKPGDGLRLTEEWDALYFYNPSKDKCPAGSTNLKNCPYEMLPDGQYPFFVSARSNEPFNRYYYNKAIDGTGTTGEFTGWVDGAPFKQGANTTVKQQDYLYATDKISSKINVTRGSVYFLDGSTVVYPNAPQLFNVSSGPVFVPPYEINFSVSRAATVEIAIVALQPGVCNPDPTVRQDLKNNIAGDVCKFLSTMTIVNTSNFDPNIVRKTYWDGTDNNGFYVKPGIYEVRLTAKNYPDPGLYQPTVKSITLNADLLKVFDLLEADGYAISQRGTNMRIGYQISVPMKVGIQIFKPGTTIYDYQKGTLRNPTTGTEVKDIREVLVKAITGIRPATTLIEEIWDGTDYAGQEVPDGTYPFRFVTAVNSADIDSVTGEIVGDWGDTDGNANPALWKINRVADTYEYQNLHKATIAIGDGQFVCEDWEKTVFFYPNPFNDASKGTLEITKMPVPGEVSIKFYNLAGDLVRDSGYQCVDANNYTTTMGSSLKFQPDNNVSNTRLPDVSMNSPFPNIRNAALRCRWDRTNQHGKKVARGVYFGLIDFKAQMGREHCQKVVKILIP